MEPVFLLRDRARGARHGSRRGWRVEDKDPSEEKRKDRTTRQTPDVPP